MQFCAEDLEGTRKPKDYSILQDWIEIVIYTHTEQELGMEVSRFLDDNESCFDLVK